jgi:aminotransferase
MYELDGLGRLSKRVAGLKPSGIRKFFDIAATMKDVISLGIGEPDFTTPKPILEAGLRSLQNGETHYTSNHGRLELRTGIANNLKRLYGVEYDPAEEMIVTVGVSEALYLTMTAILDPGDEVIIPTPCFVAYQAEVIMAGGVPVEIPTYMQDNFQVEPARIRAAHQGHIYRLSQQSNRCGGESRSPDGDRTNSRR